jgi:hypothetical protein
MCGGEPVHPDPRSHRRYVELARKYIAAHARATCVLCGVPIDLSLPRTAPGGPTIEHRYPVRRIRVEAQTWADCLALTCDTSMWALAHRRCQSRQGAIAANKMRAGKRRAPQLHSRQW